MRALSALGTAYLTWARRTALCARAGRSRLTSTLCVASVHRGSRLLATRAASAYLGRFRTRTRRCVQTVPQAVTPTKRRLASASSAVRAFSSSSRGEPYARRARFAGSVAWAPLSVRRASPARSLRSSTQSAHPAVRAGTSSTMIAWRACQDRTPTHQRTHRAGACRALQAV
jgi:hypothetical protein